MCIDCQTTVITGNPDPKHISTSHVERQNLTMRMCMRQLTRLTNAFSKKLENHVAAVALYFMYYNLCASTRRSAFPRRWPLVSPASCGRYYDIVKLVENREAEAAEAKKNSN